MGSDGDYGIEALEEGEGNICWKWETHETEKSRGEYYSGERKISNEWKGFTNQLVEELQGGGEGHSWKVWVFMKKGQTHFPCSYMYQTYSDTSLAFSSSHSNIVQVAPVQIH